MQTLLHLFLMAAMWASPPPPANNTWYVRADGGTFYDATANPTGRCSGKANAPDTGSGVNQPCAVNDFRWLYDQKVYGTLQWKIAGGDRIVVQPLPNGGQYRLGSSSTGSGVGPDGFCVGISPRDCRMPEIPSGSTANPTTIVSSAYLATGTCNVGIRPDVTKMARFAGGHSLTAAFSMNGSHDISFECVDVGSFNPHCQLQGSTRDAPCNGDQYQGPIDDFVVTGISTVQGYNLTFQDVRVFGPNSSCFFGNAGPGTITGNRVYLLSCPQTGWNFDDATNTPAGAGAHFILTNSRIAWSGCMLKATLPYPDPRTDAQEAADLYRCLTQDSGSVADAIGTPAGSGMDVTLIGNQFAFNTQDGPDFGHVDQGNHTLIISGNASYGNAGGTFKWGGYWATITFTNNLLIADCSRLTYAFPGLDASAVANFPNICRSGDALSPNFKDNTVAVFANNTIVTTAPTSVDFACFDPNRVCTDTQVYFENNIILGYTDPNFNSGQAPGTFCGASCNNLPGNVGHFYRRNNIFWGLRSCPANQITPDTTGDSNSSGEVCQDPKLTNEPATFAATALDDLAVGLQSSSPAVGAGVVVSGLTSDFLGNPYRDTTHPPIGAMELSSAYRLPVDNPDPLPVTPTPTPTPSGAIYYLSPTGSDANPGSQASPWLSPNHSLNCGDTILAAAGTYNYLNFGRGHWGAVNCPGNNNVAWLKCATFDTCKNTVPQGVSAFAFDVSANYWGVQGWEASDPQTDPSMTGGCFNAEPYATPLHHIIFANNVANTCAQSAIGGGLLYGTEGSAATARSVDYEVIVGNIAYGSGYSNVGGSNIGIFIPIAVDKAPGTHIYIAGNWTFNARNPPGQYDGNGIILDTFDNANVPGLPPFGQQVVVENNFAIGNGAVGLRPEYGNKLASGVPAGTPQTPEIFRYNTAWGNSQGTYLGGNTCGELQIYNASNVTAYGNLLVTAAANCYGQSGVPLPPIQVMDSGGSNSVYGNDTWSPYGVQPQIQTPDGHNDDTESAVFAFGANTFANPQLASPALLTAAPDCSTYADVPHCMAAVVANFHPQVQAAQAYGYQTPSTTNTFDPLFPQWLCNVGLPAGLVTMGCKTDYLPVAGMLSGARI